MDNPLVKTTQYSNFEAVDSPLSPACLASFRKAAAKLDWRVALSALLVPADGRLLLGDTWVSGGMVTVVLVTELIAFSGGAFEPAAATPGAKQNKQHVK